MTATQPDDKLGRSVADAEGGRAVPTGSWISRPDGGTLIRPLAADDADTFVALANESLQFHQKWIKMPADVAAFERYLSGFDNKNSFCFVICDEDSIVGSVSLTGIESEPYHRGRLGYGVFEPYANRGYTSFGLERVIRFAFEDVGLHRLEADVQRENEASKRVVKKMGFACEGVSQGFIRIAGEWVDHERWALTFDGWLRWLKQRQSDLFLLGWRDITS